MSRTFFLAAGVLWILATAAGTGVLWDYAHQPGASSSAPRSWPSAAAGKALGGAKLLVFLHPECPCSRATVEELGRIVARRAGPFSLCVYVYESTSFERAASDGPLWKAASRISGVQMVADKEGEMARAFAVRTSGASLLYDASGRLLFQGGVTGARGHEGENSYEDALLACLRQAPSVCVTTPTYGCSIF